MNLNEQYNLLMDGKYAEAKAMCYQLHEDAPWNNDIAFNSGWFKLSDGEVVDGYTLLDRGREKGPHGHVWGDPHFGSTQPIWRGTPNCTVLLRLERGMGDQFHQVRYARQLKAKGCTVVVSGQAALADVLRHADDVDVVVQHEAAAGVLHDFYLPAMSSPMYMGEDCIQGGAYIERPPVAVVPNRVGLCWQGNSAYEHETKRKFPAELLFNVMAGRGDCISLQRDEGFDLCPDWVERVNLNTWVDTATEMARCSLIVTSCTSIAHLAGAMGIPTMIIVPVVPYYLWTLPGISTPHYDSVTLLRQTDPDDWLAPFNQLAEMVTLREAA